MPPEFEAVEWQERQLASTIGKIDFSKLMVSVSQVELLVEGVEGFEDGVLTVAIGEFLSCKQEIRSRNENKMAPSFFMILPDLIYNFTFDLNRFCNFGKYDFRNINFIIR